ncbi:ATP-binding protein [Pendulispora albinea]|uniref:DNA polymerase III subunit delta n=1 Tax=Pendulispora albinea TaxID=2741071 RepID=A0ABZ2LMM7_9BACT
MAIMPSTAPDPAHRAGPSRTILGQVRSQPTAVATLERALATGRVHHAYLFDGPDGVGKELAAFGLAQALVCEVRGSSPAAGAAPEACGECSACKRTSPREGHARPLHPDVVVLERGLYEPAQIGRRTPEAQELSIDQVRTLVLARAAFPPHEGRAKVFIVRRADELSISATNALLKTLEEPGKGTHFILLCSRPDTLLPTIRSRTLRVRFAPLPDTVVTELLVARGTAQETAGTLAALSGGSMATALALADPEESSKRQQFVEKALAAVESPDLGTGLELAEEAKKNKDVLEISLQALAIRLAEEARRTAANGDRHADVAAARYRLALSAAQELDANASPQLTVESMIVRMRSV